MISILFTQKNSVYQQLKQDCWNIEKNALSWPGGNPIIAHPPCRLWGTLRGLAKHTPGEKYLAVWSINQIRKWGGILEHPRNSRLWTYLKLPKPGSYDEYGGWTLNIQQNWFGHKCRKNTFLYIKGISPGSIPDYPISLNAITHIIGGGKNPSKKQMGKKENESTPIEFAKWLIKTCELIYENTQMDINKRIL